MVLIEENHGHKENRSINQSQPWSWPVVFADIIQLGLYCDINKNKSYWLHSVSITMTIRQLLAKMFNLKDNKHTFKMYAACPHPYHISCAWHNIATTIHSLYCHLSYVTYNKALQAVQSLTIMSL